MARFLVQNKGITIIEVMIVMLILSVWILGSYQVASQWNNLERMTENRTKAVAFAREWLEVVENIRDTNWLKFSTNYEGCFDVLNYDISCTTTHSGAIGTVTRINSGSYTVSQNAQNIWRLTEITIPSGVDENSTGVNRATYVNLFPLMLNGSGASTQIGSAAGIANCKNDLQKNCDTGFTREIRITRPGSNWILNPIQIKSIVTWVDWKQKTPYVIELDYTLQNWKYAFYKTYP